jgi:hypothetical protein
MQEHRRFVCVKYLFMGRNKKHWFFMLNKFANWVNDTLSMPVPFKHVFDKICFFGPNFVLISY